MTLISKGRAINKIAISILIIVCELVIIFYSPESLLAFYLFIGHMGREQGCYSRDGRDGWSPKMQIKMFVIKATDHNGFLALVSLLQAATDTDLLSFESFKFFIC